MTADDRSRPATAAGDASMLLFAPGTAPDASAVGDRALLGALLDAETGWVSAQADLGLLSKETAAEVVAALEGPADYPLADIAADAASGGNPVIPFLAHARERVAGLTGSSALHRGLTSQDVMDTAMVLVLARTIAQVRSRLDTVISGFAELAISHCSTPCLAHTLTQAALPTTAGLRFAHWARSLADSRDALARMVPTLQLGGAAGTRAALGEFGGSGASAAGEPRRDMSADGSGDDHELAGDDRGLSGDDFEAAWAARLGLAAAGYPWHVDRLRVLDWAQALAAVSLVGQRVARDVLTGARTEVGELREAGGGGSSAMPQKSNPTVSVLLSRTGQEAPGLLATVAQAVGQAVDERPDGAWHAEWTALARLQLGALTSARLLGDLVDRLEVDEGRMRENLEAAGPGVVSERLVHALAPDVTKAQITEALGGAVDSDDARERLAAVVPAARRSELEALLDPAEYTGEATALVDRILATIDHSLTADDPSSTLEDPSKGSDS